MIAKCLDCGDSFEAHVARSGSHKLRCPICWPINEKKRAAEYQKMWREKNSEHIKQRRRERWLVKKLDPDYRVIANARSLKWNSENRDVVNERSRKWNAENAERKRLNDKRWVEANRERVSEYGKRYAARNPAKMRAKSHIRYARLSGAEGSFTAQEWADLCKKYDGRCAYCGMKRPLTVDHVVPLSRGGANTIDNLAPACRSCNSSKGAQTAEEFAAKVGVAA